MVVVAGKPSPGRVGLEADVVEVQAIQLALADGGFLEADLVLAGLPAGQAEPFGLVLREELFGRDVPAGEFLA